MTAISLLNTGLVLPADVSGYTLPTGALIPITDPGDLQESSVGTTKAVPVLRILDHTVSIKGGFNATTSTPNLLNATGSTDGLDNEDYIFLTFHDLELGIAKPETFN